MRVVTFARKPCSAKSVTANVIEHGCGAINVDGTRITGPAWTRSTETIEDMRGGRYGTASKDRIATGPQEMPEGGRWPPNVVLVHREPCRVVGARKVAAGTAHRKNSGGRTIFSETEKPSMKDMTYADADGRETVPDWRCELGCAVAELDRQSGVLSSGAGAVKRASAGDRLGNRSATYGAESRLDGEPQVCYGDRGGASRFFRHFRKDGGSS